MLDYLLVLAIISYHDNSCQNIPNKRTNKRTLKWATKQRII
nr:MAG TPA: hypothetical protein [Caudoviricetes sp.]DAJ88455.1 MAG TPA: hypothetical protein [Bacteriophage sp.]DAK87601.1 MAG TPA: hypothetical protein [Bacteriophage sp.]DAM09517.1 MAG TPA: hypothetical protein [Bacteriophage sp.]DAR98893.1 MAG TPA: hypothetical protein [Bacteriophage sp.]